MTQTEKILRHLQDYDLRREEHPIVTEVVEGRNRYDEKTRWARYRMGARG